MISIVEDEQLYNKIREAVNAIPMNIGFEGIDGISEYITKTLVKSNPVYQDGSDSGIYGVETHIENEETVIGVVPATRPTYGIFGLMPLDDLSLEQVSSLSFSHFGEDKFLGFEYEGVEHPDWISMLRERWIEIIYEHEMERELWGEVQR